MPTAATPDLQTLIDRQAVADLVSGLGRWLDDHAFDDARSVLADDVAVESPGGTARGLDAVVAQARRNHEAFRTQHVFTDVLVDLHGDRATARANLVGTFADEGNEPAPFYAIAARYRLEAVRTGGGWRLAHIAISPVWRSGRRPA